MLTFSNESDKDAALMRKLTSIALTVTTFGLFAPVAKSEVIVVREISATPAPDAWTLADTTGGGTASLVGLDLIGGVVNSTQPGGPGPGGLHPGVAMLTTDGVNASRAELGTFGDFGLATDVLTGSNFSYSYFKDPVGQPSPAPSLKIELSNPNGTGPDSYGQLIYEPYMQGSGLPPTGSWQNVLIDESTGSGTLANGGWWWSGGFGIPNGAGGAPYRSSGGPRSGATDFSD